MRPFNKSLLLTLSLGAIFSSCKKEESPNNPTPGNGSTKYIIASTPTASTGVADYLLTADNLTGGSISTIGNGIEQDGSYRYYITHKNRFFSLLYGQGNPGAVTTYDLDESGALVKASDFQTETVQVFTQVNDDLLLIKVPRSGNTDATLIRINAEQAMISGESKLNIVDVAGNGERAHFTWATQVGNKVFAPYMSIKGAAPDVFGTAYPDSTWIAVLSYPDLKVEKIIRDNRTSSIGAYFNNGLAVVEGGDVYGFSPASATTGGIHASTKPSGIVRIQSGETEFDQNYFFNVQAASGGHHMFRWDYAGNGKFLVQMYGQPNTTSTGAGIYNKLAIVDVFTQSFMWVTGAPADVPMFNTSRNNLLSEDGKTYYIGMSSESQGSYVMAVDVNTATATKGLKVEGGNITAISKLSY